MRKYLCIIFAALVMAVVAPVVHADTVTITETITASGSLGGVAFSNALVTFEMTGDTGSIFNAPGVSTLIAPATVSVSGVGAVTFTDSIRAGIFQGPEEAGFFDNNLDFGSQAMLITLNPAFAAATLTNQTGPVSGLGLAQIGFNFPTTGGDFVITSSADVATFTSTSAVVTPEPSSLLLIGAGLLGLVAASRKLCLA